MGVPDWMIIQRPKAFVTEPLIKRGGLKLEYTERDIVTPARTGFGFGDPHEFRTVIVSTMLLVNPESCNVKPSSLHSTDQTALDLAFVCSQEDVYWHGPIRNTVRIEVEAAKPLFNELDVLRCGSRLT